MAAKYMMCFICRELTPDGESECRNGYYFCPKCIAENKAVEKEEPKVSPNWALQTSAMRDIQCRYGKITVKFADQFVWNDHTWFVLEPLGRDEIIVRLEGTPDVAVLPAKMVAELVEDYNFQSGYWR